MTLKKSMYWNKLGKKFKLISWKLEKVELSHILFVGILNKSKPSFIYSIVFASRAALCSQVFLRREAKGRQKKNKYCSLVFEWKQVQRKEKKIIGQYSLLAFLSKCNPIQIEFCPLPSLPLNLL